MRVVDGEVVRGKTDSATAAPGAAQICSFMKGYRMGLYNKIYAKIKQWR